MKYKCAGYLDIRHQVEVIVEAEDEEDACDLAEELFSAANSKDIVWNKTETCAVVERQVERVEGAE